MTDPTDHTNDANSAQNSEDRRLGNRKLRMTLTVVLLTAPVIVWGWQFV